MAKDNHLQSLYDFPTVVIERGDQKIVSTFLIGVKSKINFNPIDISQDVLTSVYDWFSLALNRPANGPEIYSVAKQLYVSGRYSESIAAIMLFRGHLDNISVHGGGCGDLNVTHLMAHICKKLGYHYQALKLITEVFRKRDVNSLTKSVRLLSFSSKKVGRQKNDYNFEESWQLLVESACIVHEDSQPNKDNEDEDEVNGNTSTKNATDNMSLGKK